MLLVTYIIYMINILFLGVLNIATDTVYGNENKIGKWKIFFTDVTFSCIEKLCVCVYFKVVILEVRE